MLESVTLELKKTDEEFKYLRQVRPKVQRQRETVATLGGKNQTREQKASICEEKARLDGLRIHCWNELNGFLSLTVCMSLPHTHTHSWHAVFHRDLSASSGNSASSLQIQVPYKSLPLSHPPYLPFLPCFYTGKQAHAFPHACTPHFLHTHTRTHKSGDDTSYWTAPHFLACTIYEAVDGQQHIVMCAARAAAIGWRPGSRGGEAEDGCDWSELKPLKAEDFLCWMAAALGGAWVTLLGKKPASGEFCAFTGVLTAVDECCGSVCATAGTLKQGGFGQKRHVWND